MQHVEDVIKSQAYYRVRQKVKRNVAFYCTRP